MSKIIIGIIIVVVLIIVAVVVSLFVVHVEKLIVDSTNNNFTIALCGTCNGPAAQFGGDVAGMLRPGKYSAGEFMAELSRAMNDATALKTGVTDEWNVALDNHLKTISILSNTRRSWTFKSHPTSFYQMAGLSAAVDNFWVFWNGRPENSTFTGSTITMQSLPLIDTF
jgi:hypothetical protein